MKVVTYCPLLPPWLYSHCPRWLTRAPGSAAGNLTLERAFYNSDPRDIAGSLSPHADPVSALRRRGQPGCQLRMHLLLMPTASWVDRVMGQSDGLEVPGTGHRTPPFTLDFVIMPDLTGYMNVSAEGDCTGAGIPTTAKTQYIPA